jgi:hypothetical protein
MCVMVYCVNAPACSQNSISSSRQVPSFVWRQRRQRNGEGENLAQNCEQKACVVGNPQSLECMVYVYERMRGDVMAIATVPGPMRVLPPGGVMTLRYASPNLDQRQRSRCS